jgi:hypothetical protein
LDWVSGKLHQSIHVELGAMDALLDRLPGTDAVACSSDHPDIGLIRLVEASEIVDAQHEAIEPPTHKEPAGLAEHITGMESATFCS